VTGAAATGARTLAVATPPRAADAQTDAHGAVGRASDARLAPLGAAPLAPALTGAPPPHPASPHTDSRCCPPAPVASSISARLISAMAARGRTGCMRGRLSSCSFLSGKLFFPGQKCFVDGWFVTDCPTHLNRSESPPGEELGGQQSARGGGARQALDVAGLASA